MTETKGKHGAGGQGIGEHVAEAVGDLGQGLKETASRVADAAGEKASELADGAAKAAGRAKEFTQSLLKDLERGVRDRPFLWVGCAAGVGLLAGMLFCRRD